jgi:hypothetical protein
MSTAGSTSCKKCPSGTLYVNSTYCKEINDVKKDGGQDGKPEEEVPKKDGSNNVMVYVLGIAVVAVLVFVTMNKCSQKPTTNNYQAETEASEKQNEMRTLLIHDDKDVEKFVIKKTVM